MKLINGVTYCDRCGKPTTGNCELNGEDLCISCSIQKGLDKEEYKFDIFK